MILDTPAILALVMQCSPQVAPSTMRAMISAESAGNPFAIGVNSGRRLTRQPRSQAEAVATARELLDRGHNIDLGLGQINSGNLHWLGLSIEAAFDPCSNVAAAARILADNYRRAANAGAPSPLGAALSAYNTGSMTRGYANGYVARVVRAAGAVAPSVPVDVPDAAPSVAEEDVDRKSPPRWDVFAQYSWSRRQSAASVQSDTIDE